MEEHNQDGGWRNTTAHSSKPRTRSTLGAPNAHVAALYMPTDGYAYRGRRLRAQAALAVDGKKAAARGKSGKTSRRSQKRWQDQEDHSQKRWQ
jgi:hypothetical protein